MNVNNFLQSEAAQFVGTAAANTIGLVIGTIHEDIKALLQIPDEYQAISIVCWQTVWTGMSLCPWCREYFRCQKTCRDCLKTD